jgi:hypothetical protein
LVSPVSLDELGPSNVDFGPAISTQPLIAAEASAAPPSSAAGIADPTESSEDAKATPTEPATEVADMPELRIDDLVDEMSTGSSTPGADDPEEDADLALARELRGETVRDALESITAEAMKEVPVGGTDAAGQSEDEVEPSENGKLRTPLEHRHRLNTEHACLLQLSPHPR